MTIDLRHEPQNRPMNSTRLIFSCISQMDGLLLSRPRTATEVAESRGSFGQERNRDAH